MDNVESVKAAHDSKNVLFGNINTYLIYKLTNGSSFCTDVSNASRTFLMDLQTLEYSQELLDLFGIDKSSLPEIKPTFASFGFISSINLTDLEGVEITCSIGDQQGSALGQGVLSKGETKITYGTGCFLITNTGKTAITQSKGLIATVIYQTNEGEVCYGLEAAVECGANTINWMKNTLRLFEDFDELENLVDQTQDNGDVYFVPCFAGLYSPFWDDNAKSVLVGLSNHSHRSHILRACLEGIAYRVYDCVNSLNEHLKVKRAVVDGGIMKNKFFREFQRDSLGIDLRIIFYLLCRLEFQK